MPDDTVTVIDEPDHQRYVVRVGDERAGELVYRPSPSATVPTRVLLHTGVDPAFGGRGLGSRLIAAALADCREHGLAVLPQCPFVKAHLNRHPEDLDVVPPGDRAAYGLPPG